MRDGACATDSGVDFVGRFALAGHVALRHGTHTHGNTRGTMSHLYLSYFQVSARYTPAERRWEEGK